MSAQERLRLECDMVENPDDVLVGATTNNLTHLERRRPATLATSASEREPLPAPLAVFATRSIELAIFCAAVYSRDGWSGWNTYENPDGGPELHEFFAAPRALRKAVMALRQGAEASVYRGKPNGFKPYLAIPGQFIAEDADIPVVAEYRVNITDMRQRIVRTASLARDEAPRLELVRAESPDPNLDSFLLCRDQVPGFEGLTPVQVASALRRWSVL